MEPAFAHKKDEPPEGSRLCTRRILKALDLQGVLEKGLHRHPRETLASTCLASLNLPVCRAPGIQHRVPIVGCESTYPKQRPVKAESLQLTGRPSLLLTVGCKLFGGACEAGGHGRFWQLLKRPHNFRKMILRWQRCLRQWCQPRGWHALVPSNAASGSGNKRVVQPALREV